MYVLYMQGVNLPTSCVNSPMLPSSATIQTSERILEFTTVVVRNVKFANSTYNSAQSSKQQMDQYGKWNAKFDAATWMSCTIRSVPSAMRNRKSGKQTIFAREPTTTYHAPDMALALIYLTNTSTNAREQTVNLTWSRTSSYMRSWSWMTTQNYEIWKGSCTYKDMTQWTNLILRNNSINNSNKDWSRTTIDQ